MIDDFWPSSPPEQLMGRLQPALVVTAVFAAMALAAGVAAPARADAQEDKFIADIKNSNSVATNIPGTPDRWLAAGRASCDRITRTSRAGRADPGGHQQRSHRRDHVQRHPRQDALSPGDLRGSGPVPP